LSDRSGHERAVTALGSIRLIQSRTRPKALHEIRIREKQPAIREQVCLARFERGCPAYVLFEWVEGVYGLSDAAIAQLDWSEVSRVWILVIPDNWFLERGSGAMR
jgi:hypothetical protein